MGNASCCGPSSHASDNKPNSGIKKKKGIKKNKTRESSPTDFSEVERPEPRNPAVEEQPLEISLESEKKQTYGS